MIQIHNPPVVPPPKIPTVRDRVRSFLAFNMGWLILVIVVLFREEIRRFLHV